VTEYRISQLAERTGFSASTLRFYEQAGLLPGTARTPGGYRTYDERAVARLRFIARAKQLGLPLDEIRELAAVWDAGVCAPVQGRLATLVEARITEVQARISELTEFLTQLVSARAVFGRHTPDGPCDPGCGCVSQPPDVRRGPRPVALLSTRPDPVPPMGPPDLDPPIACTLTNTEQQARSAAWTQLLALVTDREPTPDGLRLGFPADAELAGKLATLAAHEQHCCAFFHFTVEISDARLVLQVSAPEQARDLLDALFGGQP